MSEKETIKYAYVGSKDKDIDSSSILFSTYEDAAYSAEKDQPLNRPYRIVKVVTRYEVCGVVE